MPPTPDRGRIPISWKREFSVQKPPFPVTLTKAGKGNLRSQNPHCVPLQKKGDFWTENSFPRTRGNGGFWTENSLFQEMGIRPLSGFGGIPKTSIWRHGHTEILPPHEQRVLLCCLKGQKRLVSHYSAIGDTISCDAPYSTIGYGGKLFLRYPPSKACLWTAIGHLYGEKWGCSSDSLRYHRKHSATGVARQVSRDRGVFRLGH